MIVKQAEKRKMITQKVVYVSLFSYVSCCIRVVILVHLMLVSVLCCMSLSHSTAMRIVCEHREHELYTKLHVKKVHEKALILSFFSNCMASFRLDLLVLQARQDQSQASFSKHEQALPFFLCCVHNVVISAVSIAHTHIPSRR